MKDPIVFNKEFVKTKAYIPYETSKYPNDKVAIVTCMDARLITLLPAALGIENGDAVMIKNAGGVILHPFGSELRSLMVAIYDLNVTKIMVIGHTDCGVLHMDSDAMLKKMHARGVLAQDINQVSYYGVSLDEWLSGFQDVEESVQQSVELLHKHPFIPNDVTIEGYVMDSKTGELKTITCE